MHWQHKLLVVAAAVLLLAVSGAGAARAAALPRGVCQQVALACALTQPPLLCT